MPSLATRIVRKAFRPFYRPYYRLLWRRRFPGADLLERWVSRWEAVSGRADVPLSPEAWDAAYAEGFWDFLSEADEEERYRRIAGLLPDELARGAILDVGCGDGLLRDYLPPEARYLGIDLSSAAIDRARARKAPVETDAPLAGETSFEVANAETWQPPGPFDAVVLNECLYYFERPLTAAQRYLEAVSPGGALIVSMFLGPRSEAIGRRLVRAFPPAEETELRKPKGRWSIRRFEAP